MLRVYRGGPIRAYTVVYKDLSGFVIIDTWRPMGLSRYSYTYLNWGGISFYKYRYLVYSPN